MIFLRDSLCLSAVSLSRQRLDILDFSYCPWSCVLHVTLANWRGFGFEFHLRSTNCMLHSLLHRAEETQQGRNSSPRLQFGFQFGLYRVVAPLSFPRSISLASLITTITITTMTMTTITMTTMTITITMTKTMTMTTMMTTMTMIIMITTTMMMTLMTIMMMVMVVAVFLVLIFHLLRYAGESHLLFY